MERVDVVKVVRACPVCKRQSYGVILEGKDIQGECVLCGYKKQILSIIEQEK